MRSYAATEANSSVKPLAKSAFFGTSRRSRTIGAVVHLLAIAIIEGRGLPSMSGILADSSYGLLPA